MQKIKTLFKKDPKDLSKVTMELDPNNAWAIEVGIPTRKYDWTACAVINWEIYKRYDCKAGIIPPVWAIPCQEPDELSGHRPHRVRCERGDTGSKYFLEAFDTSSGIEDWTYELCWPKVQGNPEKLPAHTLVPHGKDILEVTDRSYEGIRQYLTDHDIEGIVFHHPMDGRMCKIRKKDFWIKR